MVVGPGSAAFETTLALVDRLPGMVTPRWVSTPTQPIALADVLSPRLSSYRLHLVTPVNAQMARPLIEGLRNPTVARDDRIRELVPFPLTSFDEAARAALRTRR